MGDLSKHFSRSEFECKCGCGQDTIDAELIMLCETVREMNGNQPLSINSGNRCKKYNEIVGGSQNSQHILSRAADLPVRNPTYIFDLLCMTFPDKYGFGLYHWGVHVDSRSNAARWRNLK